jgi:hypothetical protein
MSTEQSSATAPPGLRPGWNRLRPEKLPEPTAWPAALALAVTLMLWGFVSSLISTGVGLALFVVALAGWIGDIRHERKHLEPGQSVGGNSLPEVSRRQFL